MNDAAKTSSNVPSTCAQNPIHSLLIIHIIASHQIYVPIDNPLLVLPVSCLTTTHYLSNHGGTAHNISYTENLQTNCCWRMSQLYEYQDKIQGTRVFW